MVSHLKLIAVTLLLVLSPSAFALSDSAKVEFKKKDITIVFPDKKISKKIRVEIAESPAQHERGLMFRKGLGKDEGMLFIFEEESVLSFWMKNTIIDLSIGYFNKDLKLIDIQEMAATTIMQTRLPNYPSKGPAKYALEMSSKWFEKNKVQIGSTLKLDSQKN